MTLRPFTRATGSIIRTWVPLGFLLGVALCWLVVTPAQAVQYTVQDLGALGGSSASSWGFDINDSGQVVGDSTYSAGGSRYAFVYSGGAMHDLGTLGGVPSSARGISGNGQVVGYSTTSSGLMHAYLYSGGVMQDLNRTGIWSMANAVNNNGQVVGGINTISDAFLYSGGVMQDLGAFGGPGNGSAEDINGSGQVTGWAITSAGLSHAFLYSNGAMQDLGAPSGAQSEGYAINNNGQVAGDSLPTSGPRHACLFSGGAMQDLDTLNTFGSTAYGLNDNGQVVGTFYSAPSSQKPRAFLYNNGQMIDLNSLVPANLGWTLVDAEAINNLGQIVVTGQNAAGNTHAMVLTPVPEPAALSLLAVGGLALVGRKRQPRA